MNYPKIIHQTWKTNDIPEDWKISQLKWKELHPDFEYMFWTDNDIRNYIKTNHPSYLDLHDNYKHNIQRADMIRYFILYDFGGIYCDLDLYPIENIENHLLNYNSDILVCKSGNIDMITNSFIISKKNATIWLKVQEKLKDKKPFFAIGKHLTVMYTTGSIMLSNMLKKNKEYFSLLPSEKFMAYSSNDDFNIVKEGAIILPLKGQSWNGIDSLIFNLLNKYRNQITDLIIDEKMQKELSTSLIDKTCNIDYFGSLFLSGLKKYQIENIKNTSLITYDFLTQDETEVNITVNHKEADGIKIIKLLKLVTNQNISNIQYNNNDNNTSFKKYVLSPIISINMTKTYITNKFLTSPFLETSNTLLKYAYFTKSIKDIKKDMKVKNILHMSSFLFTLLVSAYWKKTGATFIKCRNTYYIPHIEGNNKLMDWCFIVNINNSDDNVSIIESMYKQIYKNNKTIDEMWGLHTVLNIFYENKKNIFNETINTKELNKKNNIFNKFNSTSDIVFSNIPIKVNINKIQITDKTSQPEKFYCLCIGNELNELMFSLVYDESIDGIQDIFQETINNL